MTALVLTPFLQVPPQYVTAFLHRIWCSLATSELCVFVQGSTGHRLLLSPHLLGQREANQHPTSPDLEVCSLQVGI